MILYLAGGVQANIKFCWQSLLTAIGGQTCKYIWQEHKGAGGALMNILGGGRYAHLPRRTIPVERGGGLYDDTIKKFNVAILESYYYADEWTEKTIPLISNFLLDSGAFTFMSNSHKGKIDWKAYIDGYCDFINRNNVERFFELDIDSIVGYDNVLRIRKYIEEKTSKKCIPVWHKSRGKEEFLRMCDEYDYVAIGGIVTKEIKPNEYPFFTWFINEAHKRHCKIHGLGFTNLQGLTKYHFDSVDSTSWTTGNRFGSVYVFNGKTIVKYDKKQGQRLSDAKAVAIHNFNEWVKFQRYADKNL